MNYEQTIIRLVDERRATTTQSEVAKKMGAVQAHISKFEQVKNGNYPTVERYAAALGYKVSIRLINKTTGEVIE